MEQISILIAEDEPVVAADLTETLGNLGYRVYDFVTTGEEAVDAAADLKPDLVLMDIILAGKMDGIAAAGAIQKNQGIPVIFLTAHNDRATFARAKETGPYGYLIKPLNLNDIYSTVETALHRRMLEEKLRHSEELFRTVVDFTADWEYWIGPDGRFVYCSPSCAELTGYGPEEFMANPALMEAIIFPDDRERVMAHAAEVGRDRVCAGMDFRVVKKNGEVRWMAHRCRAVMGADGHYRGRRGSNRDITERMTMYEALRVREDTISALLNAVTESALLIDRDGLILAANEATARRLGRKPGEMAGGNAFSYLEPEVAAGRKSRAEEAIRTGRPVRFNDVRGGMVYDNHIYPITGPSGEVYRLAIYGRDVTDEMKNLKELEESRRFSEKILNITPSIIYIFDVREKRDVYINRSIAETLGYSPKEIREMRDGLMPLLIHPDDRYIVEQNAARVARAGDGEIVESEYRVKHADGNWRWILSRETAFSRLPDGAPEQTLGVVQDITARKAAELEHLINERRLEALQKLHGMSSVSMERIYDFVLEESTALTGSAVGFIGIVDGGGENCVIHAWSASAMAECAVKNIYREFSIEHSGVWAESARRKAPFVMNSYGAAHPLKRGIPDGHVAIERFLSVPIMDGGEVRAVLAVANKEEDYDTTDIRMLSLLGEDMMGYVRRRRDDEQVKASLREKEILLREIHHRVKNNLQVVASMLNLQNRFSGSADPQGALQDAHRRIKTMALVHDRLYRSGDLSSVDFGSFVRAMMRDLGYTALAGDRGVEITLEADDLRLGIEQSVPSGLILSELVSNALEHGFPPGGNGGSIRVGLRQSADTVEMSVADNGRGLPEGMDIENVGSLGFYLLHLFVQQIDGAVEVKRKGGAEFLVRFKKR